MAKRYAVLAVVAVGAILAAAGPAGAVIASNDDLLNRLQSEKGDIILVGNSMQGKGIDFRALTERTGVKVSDAGFGGAMSIWQYGVVKYMIPKLEHKPKIVVVVERLNNFTCPMRRAGEYTSRSIAMTDDPAGKSLMTRLGRKGEGQPAWDKAWDNEMIPVDSYWWDFNKAVKTSFLPYMIQAAKDNGFQLVIARHRSRIFAEQPDWKPPQVKKYGEDMAAYLQANGVVFLDYDGRTELKFEHYSVGDHLNGAGRAIWTDLMAADLQAILAGKKPPNLHAPAKSAPGSTGSPSTTQPAPKPAKSAK